MAAITLNPGRITSPEMLKETYDRVVKVLPSYARPLFIRILSEQIITQTMKHRKIELMEEGFDPNIVSDPLFVIDSIARTYVPLTLDNFSKVLHSKL